MFLIENTLTSCAFLTQLRNFYLKKIMQITLRQNAIMKAYQAAEPITIQCVTGAGDLLDVTKEETYKLSPSVLITVEAEVVHEVRALPELSILLSKFKKD